jgi:rhodanese-related sulfurtransferase
MNQDQLLLLAKQRALQNNLPYAGALTPQEAFELSQLNPQAVLVDVRSRAELELVGRVPSAIHIEWAFYPGMVVNDHFSAQLQERLDEELILMFLCRTAGRSHYAAALANQLGFSHAYNVLEGFEGASNALNQRTLINGWKHAGLPWTN